MTTRERSLKYRKMLQIKGSSIKLTRGDDAIFSIDIYQPDGTLYTPSKGQRIVFSVSR